MKIPVFRASTPLAAALGLTLLMLSLGPTSSSTGALLAQDEVPMRGDKKVLTIDDYAKWRSIGQTSISPDGRWVTYAYSRREVDDSLFIKEINGGDPAVVVRGSNPEFSKDSRWVAYYINPPEQEDGGGRGNAQGGNDADRPARAALFAPRCGRPKGVLLRRAVVPTTRPPEQRPAEVVLDRDRRR